MANATIDLGTYKPAMAGDYALPVGIGYRGRITMPSAFSLAAFEISTWAPATFASSDGKDHVLFEIRKNAANWLRVTKLYTGGVELRTTAGGTEKSVSTSAVTWVSGAALFVAVDYDGTDASLRVNGTVVSILAVGTFAAAATDYKLYCGSNWAHYNNWEGYLNIVVTGNTVAGITARYASGAGLSFATWEATYAANVVLYISDNNTPRAIKYVGPGYLAVAFDVLDLHGPLVSTYPLIGYQNWVDDSALYAPAFRAVGSWEASLPLTNLKDPLISVVARTTDLSLSSTKLELDFGVSRPLRCLGIFGHNLSLDGLVRLRVSNTAGDYSFGATRYDTDWIEAYGPIYPEGLLPAGHESYATRKLSAEEWADMVLRYPWYHIIPADDITGRYVQIEFDDQANAAGFLEMGYLWASWAWQPSMSWALGRNVTVEDASRISATGGGARYYLRGPIRRAMRFNIDNLPEQEAAAYAYHIQAKRGTTRPIFVALDPANSEMMRLNTIMGDLRDLSALGWTPALEERASQGFVVTERV